MKASLRLKDGQTRPILMPEDGVLAEMLRCMRIPSKAARKTLALREPAGAPIDVPASDVAGLEIEPPHALIANFLSPDELLRVLAFTMAHAAGFNPSGVHEVPNEGPSPTGYRLRRSRVLMGPKNAPMSDLMLPKLQALMPRLWPQWGIQPQPLTLLECEVTAHGDGDFFALHTDNGMPEIAHRQVSYVYYFHREPKRFSGGQLRLYHTLFQEGHQKCGRLAAEIEPLRNGLMVFPTFIYHEVMPIRCRVGCAHRSALDPKWMAVLNCTRSQENMLRFERRARSQFAD